jgi:cytochrome oxidase Cu insertion factor (SCO1/SenC/PrrC family)
VIAVALGAGAIAYALGRGARTESLRPSGIPANVSTALAQTMQLSPVPPRPAPGFTLVDQGARTLSLASFRGRSVVLEFMDPHCTDICPLVSQEFVDAYRDLRARADGTVFIAVNVNRFHNSAAAMATYSQERGLNRIPNWHFFTGPVAALRRVWNAYGVSVYAPNPSADVIHSSIVYFIDRRGRERFVASPYADHTASGTAYLPASVLADWGRGISLVAADVG